MRPRAAVGLHLEACCVRSALPSACRRRAAKDPVHHCPLLHRLPLLVHCGARCSSAGGALPSNLFSRAFFIKLRQLLSPGGILAVNFYGDPAKPPARELLKTLHSLFGNVRQVPGHYYCRFPLWSWGGILVFTSAFVSLRDFWLWVALLRAALSGLL